MLYFLGPFSHHSGPDFIQNLDVQAFSYPDFKLIYILVTITTLVVTFHRQVSNCTNFRANTKRLLFGNGNDMSEEAVELIS